MMRAVERAGFVLRTEIAAIVQVQSSGYDAAQDAKTKEDVQRPQHSQPTMPKDGQPVDKFGGRANPMKSGLKWN